MFEINEENIEEIKNKYLNKKILCIKTNKMADCSDCFIEGNFYYLTKISTNKISTNKNSIRPFNIHLFISKNEGYSSLDTLFNHININDYFIFKTKAEIRKEKINKLINN